MRISIKKTFSVLLISLFIFTQAASANTATNCCTPPPGYNQPALISPSSPPCGCPQTNCCPTQSCPCQCQPNNCCDPCNTCNPCDACNPCGCEYARIEHLCTHKDSPVDTVKICGCEAIILPNVVLETTLGQKVFSKKLHCGDIITFSLCHGLYTKEGRKLLPSGSQIVACVECITPPKSPNKNAQVGLQFKYIMTPCGTAYPICARIFNKEGMLKESKWMSAAKVAGWSFGGLGVGAGLGAAITAGTKKVGTGIFAIGMPVGFGVGLITSLLTPGLHYRGKCGEKVLIQLTDCIQISMSQ